MIKSMTGYGKAIAETLQKKITIEIKSLNSKQLDLNTSSHGFTGKRNLKSEISSVRDSTEERLIFQSFVICSIMKLLL